MTSLQRHGTREAYKQIHLRMQRSGLSSIKVHVTRRAGKIKLHFTGSEEEAKRPRRSLPTGTQNPQRFQEGTAFFAALAISPKSIRLNSSLGTFFASMTWKSSGEHGSVKI
jgi:hypothetical protein